MACLDARAAVVIDACDRLRMRVPDDLAVIGADNNSVTCELCHVPLSSVSRCGYEVGREAAKLLDSLMAGKKRPRHDILIPPDGVVERRSTDLMAVEDPYVATAVQYVREHAHESFGVKQLLSVVPISRRWLTKRFQDTVGMTPHEFIARTRVQKAALLLTDRHRHLPLHQIAQECGFTDTRRFRIVFERAMNVTPQEYRHGDWRYR
jgi:LacI family transcriptional regulator